MSYWRTVRCKFFLKRCYFLWQFLACRFIPNICGTWDKNIDVWIFKLQSKLTCYTSLYLDKYTVIMAWKAGSDLEVLIPYQNLESWGAGIGSTFSSHLQLFPTPGRTPHTCIWTIQPTYPNYQHHFFRQLLLDYPGA